MKNTTKIKEIEKVLSVFQEIDEEYQIYHHWKDNIASVIFIKSSTEIIYFHDQSRFHATVWGGSFFNADSIEKMIEFMKDEIKNER